MSLERKPAELSVSFIDRVKKDTDPSLLRGIHSMQKQILKLAGNVRALHDADKLAHPTASRNGEIIGALIELMTYNTRFQQDTVKWADHVRGPKDGTMIPILMRDKAVASQHGLAAVEDPALIAAFNNFSTLKSTLQNLPRGCAISDVESELLLQFCVEVDGQEHVAYDDWVLLWDIWSKLPPETRAAAVAAQKASQLAHRAEFGVSGAQEALIAAATQETVAMGDDDTIEGEEEEDEEEDDEEDDEDDGGEEELLETEEDEDSRTSSSPSALPASLVVQCSTPPCTPMPSSVSLFPTC